MRILVLGGNGMAGHVIYYYLQKNPSNELFFTIRSHSNNPNSIQLDLSNTDLTYKTLQSLKPDIVINAAGILNDDAKKRMKEAITINSILPHLLAEYGEKLGFQLIHISTDCVFSGLKGHYTENNPTDGTTIYAKTKSLGEVVDDKHVTIRTSIIGPEIRRNRIGLFDWFMKQTGQIQGYECVYWNGVTTLELARVIEWMIEHKMTGLFHLTGTTVLSKYELLCLLKEIFQKEDGKILKNEMIRSDKTLVNTRDDFTFKVKDYRNMLMELKQWISENANLYKGGEMT